MTIETVDDLVEYLADQARVYGACSGVETECDGRCRPAWTADIKRRILAAVKADQDLEWLRRRAASEDGCFVSVGGLVTDLATGDKEAGK